MNQFDEQELLDSGYGVDIDALKLDSELKRKHGENLKRRWFLKMLEKAGHKWETEKKLSITLAK